MIEWCVFDIGRPQIKVQCLLLLGQSLIVGMGFNAARGVVVKAGQKPSVAEVIP